LAIAAGAIGLIGIAFACPAIPSSASDAEAA
jgi:hypothetical protein